ncbi:MAG: hypothetical protein ACR65O_08725 [Methylomicrobium sp.]
MHGQTEADCQTGEPPVAHSPLMPRSCRLATPSHSENKKFSAVNSIEIYFGQIQQKAEWEIRILLKMKMTESIFFMNPLISNDQTTISRHSNK